MQEIEAAQEAGKDGEGGKAATQECFVGQTMVFFTRKAQRILIQKKREALDKLRPAAHLIQAHIRSRPKIVSFERTIKLIVGVQAQIRRYAVQRKLQRVKQLRGMFMVAALLGRAQERFRRHRRAAIKIQRMVRGHMNRIRWAKECILRGLLMRKARIELKALKKAKKEASQLNSAKIICGAAKIFRAREYLEELRTLRAGEDIARVWRGYLARKAVKVMRHQRIIIAAIEIQGYFKTLYCRTLLAQYQASKAFEKAGKCVLATRTMNRLMDYSGRHHLKYLNPKELPTHRYAMPAYTKQGKPNPLLGSVKDGKKYVCVSVTPIPYYKYPEETELLVPGAPEETGIKRGEVVTAAQHTGNEKWLCTDSGELFELLLECGRRFGVPFVALLHIDGCRMNPDVLYDPY